MTMQRVSSPIFAKHISRILLVIGLLMMLGYFVVYVVYAANLIRFPFDYDQGEGFELVDTIMFSKGQWPYQDTETYPFYSSNYPPLFHVIAAPFVWLFGPAYWYGRLLGFLGTLVSAAAIAYAVYRGGRHRLVAVIAGLAFLASNTVYHIGPLFRQHMTMVMFEILAIVVLAHVNEIADKDKRRKQLILGLALLLAAGFTKQLAYATALAAFAFLFIRNPRRAIISGAIFGAVGVALIVWIVVATDGQWWTQTIAANVNPYNAQQTIGLYRLFWRLHGFLIVPAVLLVLYEFYFDRLSIYSLWFIAAIANGTLSGKWGAGDSYFATAIAATMILSGIFISRTLNRQWHFPENYLSRIFVPPLQRYAPQLATLALLIVPFAYIGYGRAVLHLPTTGPVFEQVADFLDIEPNAQGNFYDSAGRLVGGYADIGHLTTREDIEAGEAIVALMNATDAAVLSEEAAFSLRAGRDVITNPTQLLNLANNDLFEGDALIDMIERQEFGLIVMRAQFYPPAVLEAIGQAYQHDQFIHMNGFDYIIMRPILDEPLP